MIWIDRLGWSPATGFFERYELGALLKFTVHGGI